MASPTDFKIREFNQTTSKALEQKLHTNIIPISTLTNKLSSFLKSAFQIFQLTLVPSCKDLESDQIRPEVWISLSVRPHSVIHRALKKNYKLSLVCSKLNYANTTNRMMDTAPKVIAATMLTELKNSGNI